MRYCTGTRVLTTAAQPGGLPATLSILREPPDQGVRAHQGAFRTVHDQIFGSVCERDHTVADLDRFWLARVSWPCFTDNASVGRERERRIAGWRVKLHEKVQSVKSNVGCVHGWFTFERLHVCLG